MTGILIHGPNGGFSASSIPLANPFTAKPFRPVFG
jgi:hypothetical protein